MNDDFEVDPGPLTSVASVSGSQPQAGALSQVAPNSANELRGGISRLKAMTEMKRQLAEAQARQRAAAELAAQSYEAPINMGGVDPALMALGRGIASGVIPGQGLARGLQGFAEAKQKLAEQEWSRKAAAQQLRAQAETDIAHEDIQSARGQLTNRAALKPVYKVVGDRLMEFTTDPYTGETQQRDVGPASTSSEAVTDRNLFALATKEGQKTGITDPDELNAYVNKRFQEMKTGVKGSMGAAPVGNLPQQPGGPTPAELSAPSTAKQVILRTPEAQAGKTEESKEKVKLSMDEYKKAVDSAGNANDAALTAGTALQLMDSDSWRKNLTGPLAERGQQIRGSLVELGVIPPGSTIGKNARNVAELQGLLETLSIEKVKGFKGATSDRELDAVRRSVGGIHDPEEKLRFNLQLIPIVAQRANERIHFADQYEQQHGSKAGWESAWNKYIAQNPAFLLVDNKPVAFNDYKASFAKKYPQASPDQVEKAWQNEAKKRGFYGK